MAITIRIKPSNGLSLPKIGHLPHGEHQVDLTAADLKGAEGVEIVAPQAAAVSNQRPTSAAELNTAILAAIAGLDQDDASLWTQAPGVPKTASIEAVLGYSVSAADRDAVLQG